MADELESRVGHGPWRATFRGYDLVALEVWEMTDSGDPGIPQGYAHVCLNAIKLQAEITQLKAALENSRDLHARLLAHLRETQ